MSKAPEPGIVDGSWFQRDRITGNFVHATPPLQFTHQELTAMLTEKFEAIALIKELVEALNEARVWVEGYEPYNPNEATGQRSFLEKLDALTARAGANR